jgi:A/G-specific adenine glycosylase
MSAQEPILAPEQRDALRVALLDWYDKNRRDLPWRATHDPYAIWVSEIMLQQTQVATVLDYYARWMQRFPTIDALANAELDDVLTLWAGLGYYRRARMLHAGARYVRDALGGVMPGDAAGLKVLPGVGDYTAGAIASIAYNEPAPIVDGNVERIFARLLAIPGDPKARANQKTFWRLAAELVDPERPGDLNQAMMELGATVCTPTNPTCLLCPVRALCVGLATGQPTNFPGKVIRAKARPQDVATCVITAHHAGKTWTLLTQRPDTGLLAGLWEFPTVELPADHDAQGRAAALNALLSGLLPDHCLPAGQAVGQATHLFSHIRMTFHVEHRMLGEVDALPTLTTAVQARWVDADGRAAIALSGAQRKVERLALKLL